MKQSNRKKKHSKGTSTSSTLSALDKRPQITRDMFFVTVGFESLGKSLIVRTTFPEDVSRSVTTLKTLIRVVEDAIDTWVETSKPTRVFLKLATDTEYYRSLKQRSVLLRNTSPTSKRLRKGKYN